MILEVDEMQGQNHDDYLYLGDGDWIRWDDFGEFDPDEPHVARLPVLEWEDRVTRQFPNADLSEIRQLIRLFKAAKEYHSATGKHLNIYGAIGELFGAVVWGVRLNRKPDAQGSDGRLGNDHIEIKTIGPRSKRNRVEVKLSGNFSKLLVVKLAFSPNQTSFDVFESLMSTSRMIDRSEFKNTSSGKLTVSWEQACKMGKSSPF